MPEPRDYFNPTQPEKRPPAKRGPRAAPAIPAEFDVVLTRTSDHAGARAVEAELRAQGIEYFRTEDGDPMNRLVQLHVRSADRAFASQLAAMVFARRQRLNEIDPRQPPQRWSTWRDQADD